MDYDKDHSKEFDVVASEDLGPKKQCFTNATKMCLFDKSYSFTQSNNGFKTSGKTESKCDEPLKS